VFSIAPLMLIVIALAGLFFGADAASGRVFSELKGLIGAEGASAIQGLVKSASSNETSTFGTLIGIVTFLIGATTVFAELQSALDRIWRAPAAAGSEGIIVLLRARLLSFGLILAVGFLLLVSLLVSVALSALGNWWAPYFGGWETLLQVANVAVSLAIVTLLFAAIYKWLPRVKIGWRDVMIGAAVTGILFTVGKYLIGLYIGKSGIISGVGAAVSLIVVLDWVYYSAQVFLLGAEFTWIYAYRFGSRRNETAPPPIVRRDAPVSPS
jgi:membrane protein